MLDCFNIRKKKKIFSCHKGDFGYDYYHDPRDPLAIYLEYNIICDAQYLHRFSIKEDKNKKDAYIFSDHNSCNGGPITDHPEIAGFSREESIDFMIEKIISPLKRRDMGADLAEFEAVLREFLN